MIAVFTIIVFFLVAAVCNLCGIAPSNTTDSKATSESITSAQDSAASGSQSSSSETSGQEPQQSDEEDTEQAENHDPVIIRVTADGIELDLAGELRTLINTGINFEVTAQDEDGDTMSYFVSDSNDNNMETEKLDNDNAAFGWVSPGELGLHEIYIRVSDGNGGEANATVKVTANVLAEAFEGDGADEPDFSVFEIGPSMPMSGSLSATDILRSADPWCFAGDGFENEQIKCYLSFDISSLLGLPGIEVESAALDLGSLIHINDPEFAARLDIKAYPYGELGTEDFAVGGTALSSCSTSLYEYSFSSDALKSTLQQAIDEGKNYYQLKLGLSSATDGDGVNDVMRLSYNEIMLSVNYTAD